jgi:hypothetical protein
MPSTNFKTLRFIKITSDTGGQNRNDFFVPQKFCDKWNQPDRRVLARSARTRLLQLFRAEDTFSKVSE